MLGKSEYPVSAGSISPPITVASEPEPTETLSGGLVASVFLKAVHAQFIGSGPSPVYPGVPQSQAVAKIIREFPEALAALTTVCEDGGAFPAVPAPGSALALVIAAATSSGWPTAASPVPDDWAASVPKFRRYEIVSAMNIMMQAYHRSGVAGGSSGFPPEKP